MENEQLEAWKLPQIDDGKNRLNQTIYNLGGSKSWFSKCVFYLKNMKRVWFVHNLMKGVHPKHI